jgi:hypothetical protein
MRAAEAIDVTHRELSCGRIHTARLVPKMCAELECHDAQAMT